MTPSGDARIALTIGATRHRSLREADMPSYRRRIEAFFDDLRARYPHTPLRVLSPLAEGADRVVVEVALARGHDVFAILPLAAHDYERDFDERAPAFRALLDLIPPDRVFELPAMHVATSFVDERERAHRDAHYEQVGDYIASHCHVLLALWDGVANALPGGTGEVVQYKLTGRGPFPPGPAELLDLPDSGPVAWLPVRREDPSASNDADGGGVRWVYPEGRPTSAFDAIFGRIDAFNAAPRRTAAPGHPLLPPACAARLDREQADAARLFETADALSIHYRRVGDRVLKTLIALGVVMTLAYELYARLLPVRAMLGIYFGAFALVCVVYVWHRRVGAFEKHLDFRALAEGLRVHLFWSIAGVQVSVTDLYLRKQNDALQWIREALRPYAPLRTEPSVDPDVVHDSWIADQTAYYAASARRLNRTDRWAKLASIAFFAIGLVKTAMLFVIWDRVDEFGGFGHWSVVTVGSLPIVGALIGALADSMGYGARSKQHAILAGVFSRAGDAYRTLRAQRGERTADLQALLLQLGREALRENEDWLTLRRERPMVLPDEVRDAEPADAR